MNAKDEREAWTKHVVKAEIQRSIDRTAKRSKYGAEKKEVNGHRFDSTKEAKRYLDLALLQAAKRITDLELQPEYRIFVTPLAGGQPLAVGSYFADFRYCEAGATVIEDVKSKATATPLYRLKKKLVEALYGIKIIEV